MKPICDKNIYSDVNSTYIYIKDIKYIWNKRYRDLYLLQLLFFTFLNT